MAFNIVRINIPRISRYHVSLQPKPDLQNYFKDNSFQVRHPTNVCLLFHNNDGSLFEGVIK